MKPSRRSVLAAGALGLATACTGGSASPAPSPAPEDPDGALSRAAVAREQGLLAAYDDVAASVPALARRLAPLRAEHAAHLAALLVPSATATPGSSPTPTPSGTTSGATPARPAPAAAADAALRRLADLERAAATEHGAGAVRASRRLAPLLASLAASEASHVVVL